MPDYQCHPLWDVDEPDNIDPATLPLGDETRRALDAWAARYDRTLNEDDPLASGFASSEDELAFEADGRRLWQQVQQELGPDYRVYYFSQMDSRLEG